MTQESLHGLHRAMRRRWRAPHNHAALDARAAGERTFFGEYNPLSAFTIESDMSSWRPAGQTSSRGSSRGQRGSDSSTDAGNDSSRAGSGRRSSSSSSRATRTSSSRSRASPTSTSSQGGGARSSSSRHRSSSRRSGSNDDDDDDNDDDSTSSYPSLSSANDFGSASTVQSLTPVYGVSSSSSSAVPTIAGNNASSSGTGVGGSDLSVGAVVGIAVGGAAGLALFALIALLIARWASTEHEKQEREIMQQPYTPPTMSEYNMPPNNSNLSFAPSYDPYAEPMHPATYEGYYAGNGYAYRDPISEAAAQIQVPAPVAQPDINASYVPGQPVDGMQAQAIDGAATVPKRRLRKKRESREDNWVDAEIDPVTDYGADPYRTAGVGTQWTSPEEIEALAHRAPSEGPHSFPSSSELTSEKQDYDDEVPVYQLDTSSERRRRRRRRAASSHRTPNSEWSQDMLDAVPASQGYSRSLYDATEDTTTLSELPYAKSSTRSRRAARDLNPAHDIDLDATLAVENLRAERGHAPRSHQDFY